MTHSRVPFRTLLFGFGGRVSGKPTVVVLPNSSGSGKYDNYALRLIRTMRVGLVNIIGRLFLRNPLDIISSGLLDPMGGLRIVKIEV